MKTLHLFAGAGGGLLADLILGHEPIGAVEIDPYCCDLLRERCDDGWFPGMRVHEGDIRAFDASEYAGRVDCVSGGFPCQDISAAGKGAGLAGERSGLWSEFARVIRDVQPRFAFIENSPMLTLRGLDHVLCDLAAMGFDAEWAVISAADSGAPHLRERIWILAYHPQHGRREGLARGSDSGDSREPEQTLQNVAYAEGERVRRARRSDAKAWDGGQDTVSGSQDVANTKGVKRRLQLSAWHEKESIESEWRGEDVANPSRGRLGRPGKGQDQFSRRGEAVGSGEDVANAMRSGPLSTAQAGVHRGEESARARDEQSQRQGERVTQSGMGRVADGLAAGMDATSWWEGEPESVPRVAQGVSDRVARLKALGNGQVPLQAAMAWRILMGRIGDEEMT